MSDREYGGGWVCHSFVGPGESCRRCFCPAGAHITDEFDEIEELRITDPAEYRKRYHIRRWPSPSSSEPTP